MTADAEVGDLAQQLAEIVLIGPHQARGGLVEQQHIGTGRERASDLDESPVDMRQVGRRRRERSGIANESKQRLRCHAILHIFCIGQRRTDLSAPERNQHIVENAQRAEQLGGLIGAGDARARHFPGRRT